MLEFLGDAPLVAHNARFDFGFLNAELVKIGRDPIEMGRMVDTVALARKKHPGSKLSLDALCTRYGIDRSHRVKHGALLDAELLAQVYVELTGGRQIGLELVGDAPEKMANHTPAAAAETRAPVQKPHRETRAHCASPEELERHAAFIAGIEKAIWAQ